MTSIPLEIDLSVTVSVQKKKRFLVTRPAPKLLVTHGAVLMTHRAGENVLSTHEVGGGKMERERERDRLQ